MHFSTTLGELIKFLEERDPDLVVPLGFGKPHSYRGYYEDVAFVPVSKTTVGEMLQHAKSAMGKTFTGYKGGEFHMDENTSVWIAQWSKEGDEITPTLLRYMVGETSNA